jgi:hypothetical protein
MQWLGDHDGECSFWLVKDAIAKRHAEKIVITPRIAVAMLEKAKAASEIRPKRVEGLAQLMTAGSLRLVCLCHSTKMAAFKTAHTHCTRSCKAERRMPLYARSARNDMKPKKLLLAGDQHGSPGLEPCATKAYHRLPPLCVCLQNNSL